MTPALRDRTAQVRTWWAGLSDRERLLLTVLGSLLGLVILVYGIIQPIRAAKEGALADIRTYETLNARLRAAGPNIATTRPATVGAPDAFIVQTAASNGLTVRAVAAGQGAEATADNVPFDLALRWIGDVGRSGALAARRVDLVRTGPGRVSVRVSFAP